VRRNFHRQGLTGALPQRQAGQQSTAAAQVNHLGAAKNVGSFGKKDGKNGEYHNIPYIHIASKFNM
jgi:hypothetical protein